MRLASRGRERLNPSVITPTATKAVAGVARKIEFVEADQRDSTCPVPNQNIFRFRRRANHLYKLAPSRVPSSKGRFAIVTNVGRGMRWTLWRFKTNGAKADGEVVWS